MTIQLPVTIEQVAWLASKSDLEQIRTSVFIHEQTVPPEEEWDEHDAAAWHFLARTQDSKAVACARLLKHGKLTRMAVLQDFRGLNIGTKLLLEAEKFAAAQGLEEITLDAQCQAVNFYQRQGYSSEGSTFMDAGIEHIRMRKSLVSDITHFSNTSEATKFLVAFSLEARRNIDIFTHTLNPKLYTNCALVDALSQFARRGRESSLRLLVRNTKPLCGTDHSLVNLACRLPSRIKIKQYLDGAKDPDMGFFCVDEQHLVYFSDEPNCLGFSRRGAKAESKHVLDEFNYLWHNQSRTDPNLRQLSL